MAKRDKDSDSDSGSSSSGDEWGKKAKKKGKRIKSIKEEEEREEGEVDDDEDDDDLDDDDIDEFNDGFDDNLMGDEEDQKRLAEMTEKEREQELFNRSEKREVLRTRFEIERKLRLQKRRENTLKEKPIKNEFTEASLRSDERRRNIESKKKQNSALQGLKEQREKKKQKAQILRAADVYSSSSSSDEDDGGRKGSSSSSSSSDESDDGKRHRGRRSASDDEQPDDYEITLADLNMIRVTRKNLEDWVHSPFFATTVINSFVKMGIGMSNSKQVYRICQVVDVVEGQRIYQLEKTKTDKLLKCRHAKDEKNFSLKYVSNAEFCEPEFEEWKQRCTRDNVDFPTRSLVESKKKDIESGKNHSFSDQDIALILKEKEKFNKTPKNYAMKKTELMKMKEEAEQNNNHEIVLQLQIELDHLEERAKELDKQRTHSIAAISYINERNRLKNIAEAEKAILESQDDAKSEADDPFRRRKCAPQLVHKVQKSKNPDGTPIKVEPKQEPGMDVKKESNGSISVVDGNTLDKTKIEVKNEKKGPSSPTRDDLFDAHNFDIQIDFDIGSSLPSVGNSSFASSGNSSSESNVKPSTNRRSLNLEEYKRKKGLI